MRSASIKAGTDWRCSNAQATNQNVNSSRASLVLLVEFGVPACEGYVAPVYEYVLDLRSYFERVAVGDYQIRDLPLLDRADPIGDTKYLRWIYRHRLKRFILRQTKGSRHSSVIRQIPRISRIVGLKRDLHARLRQQAGITERRVIGIVFIYRHAQHRAD